MGYIFRIECSDCGENMRFDRKKFEITDVMEWTCWKCGTQVQTGDLRTLVINHFEVVMPE